MTAPAMLLWLSAKVLMLEGITYENGLPTTGEAEIRMLELARRRNAIEAALPPTTDEASLTFRRGVLVVLEEEEFKAREKDIDTFQAERLHALAVALAERDRANAFNSEVRVDLLRQQTRANFDEKRVSIAQKRLLTLRKLDSARAKALPRSLMQGACSGTDIIQDLSKPSSSKFAPLRREGASIASNSAKFSIERVVAPPESPEALVSWKGARGFFCRKYPTHVIHHPPVFCFCCLRHAAKLCNDNFLEYAPCGNPTASP